MRRSDAVFFLSGAAALGYETVWARLMARVLGSDAPGAAVVLAVFMGGLGLGAFAAAPLARSTKRPVALFAAIEVAVALWAALTPFLIAHVPHVDAFFARALVAAAVMAPATILLGATFPLMGRLTIRTSAETASETSAFYGANTIGAACGALITPFVLMPMFGLSGALWASAVLDLCAAALAAAWFDTAPQSVADEPGADAEAHPSASRSAWREPLLYTVFLFGASALALEVLLLRVLITVTGASVYAFGIVTFVFLTGIGLGSRQLAEQRTRTGLPASALAARVQKSRDVLFLCALSVPLLALAGLLALRYQLGERDLFAGLENRVLTGASVARVWAGHALFAGLALLPPAIAFGIALPSAAAALVGARTFEVRERTLGLVYAWNTAGALLGSLMSAFVLLPGMGPRLGVVCALALMLPAAWLVNRARTATIGLVALATAISGWFVLAPANVQGARTIVVLEHDAHTTALVEDAHSRDGAFVRSLRVNGKSEASTALVDVRLQMLLGHVPGVLHGHVRSALVVGLGTGMTAGSLLDLDGLEHLRIVEISSAVSIAARQFATWNNRVLDDPRTALTIGDGRHYVATTRDRFDLVTSDPVHPWTRGSSDLYTLEHFRGMEASLAQGGVASQWLPLYELSTDDVKTIVATWCAAFGHVSAWLSAYDLVLVGSRAAPPRAADIQDLALPERVLARDRGIGVASGSDLAALQVAGDAELRDLARGVEPMRDDRPIIEFRAPKSSMAGYSTEILRWAIRDAYVERLPENCRVRARAFRGSVGRFLDALPEGFTRAADRLGDELRDAGEPGRPGEKPAEK